MKVPPPLDTHAHVDSGIDEHELRKLGAFIFAATRSVPEFREVNGRRDLRTIWGVGVHPGLVRVQKAFDVAAFSEAMDSTPLVAEVGLDGASRVPMRTQLEVFRAVLETLQSKPRLVSVHSSSAQIEVLRELVRRPIDGVILHWWTGGPDLTREAVRLGCYFSVPPAAMGSQESLELIPTERLLPETDHPAGDRRGPLPRVPGNLKEVELRLGANRDFDRFGMRIQMWRNLSALVAAVGVREMLPVAWRDVLSGVTGPNVGEV